MLNISVVIPTNRYGGFDLTFSGLGNQTFPKDEYEVILVDDIYRRELALKYAKRYNVKNFKILKSKPNYWRANQLISVARNTGLIHAEGELIVFIDDYSWVRPKFLEKHWETYREGYCMIGPLTSIEYSERIPKDPSTLKWRHEDGRIRWVEECGSAGYRDKIYKEHRVEMKNCPAGWLYTSNASAPLKKIIEVNGFWEIADLTREEDVLLGLALERAGCKFWFRATPEGTVFHMDHGFDKLEVPKKYKPITYEDLGWKNVKVQERIILGLGGRGRCGLKTAPNEVQLVTKDVFGTEHPGSWALIEHFRRNPNLKFNEEVGFNLREERMKIGL